MSLSFVFWHNLQWGIYSNVGLILEKLGIEHNPKNLS